ncbi:MAG: hypothetical protein JOZ41_06790 [Chloroflexi bacterium]|nr:hypothetical protein [Chloroflexota bacterium]
MAEAVLHPGRSEVHPSIFAALASARLAIGIARLQRWLLRGLGLGAVLACATLAVAHLHPFGGALALCLGLVAASTLAGAATGLALWPSHRQAARIVDQHFGLNDRVTTALDFRQSPAPLAQLQRSDVARRLEGLAVRQSRRGQIAWREALLAGLAVAAFLALLLLGGAPRVGAEARSTSADRARIVRAAIVEVPAITRSLEAPSSTSNVEARTLQEIDRELALLRHQLLTAQSRGAALRAISTTQQDIQRLDPAFRPVSANAVAQLSRALASFAGPHLSKQALSTDPLANARALNQLARDLAGLTGAQRRALAGDLARASNVTADQRLRDALRQAATSLARGDPPAASKALQKAASFLTNSPIQQANRSAIQAANRQLEQLKNSVSGVQRAQGNGQTSRARSGQPRGRSGPAGQNGRAGGGSPNRQSTGRGSGLGGPTSARRNVGPGGGIVAPFGTGSSVSGGRLVAGSTRKAGEGGFVTDAPSAAGSQRGRGKSGFVYVPGVQGRGPHALQNGSSGAPQQSAIIPYRQVIVQYSRAAHAALERGVLPPSLQSYVRRYFDLLSQ